MKIIEFFGEPLSYGGQEAFAYNMYSHFKREGKYTFITPFHANNKDLLSLIEKKKDKYKAFNYNFNSILRKWYIIKAALKSITQEYDVLHIHSGSTFTLLAVAHIASKRKIRKIIVHSHATGNNDFKHGIIKKIADKQFEKKADIFLACSKEAGLFKFPKKIINSNKFKIIKNAVDLEKFRYSEEKRNLIRNELNIDKDLLICQVGRYSPEKNQVFVLKVFNQYIKKNDKTKLVFVGGDGPTKEDLLKQIQNYGLKKKVIVLSERKDVNYILSAADVFVFPSLFEGLGISAIEAQAVGLHTICSEHIPEEANVSHLFHRVPISVGIKRWVDAIDEYSNVVREDVRNEIVENGYSLEKCAGELECIYFDE